MASLFLSLSSLCFVYEHKTDGSPSFWSKIHSNCITFTFYSSFNTLFGSSFSSSFLNLHLMKCRQNVSTRSPRTKVKEEAQPRSTTKREEERNSCSNALSFVNWTKMKVSTFDSNRISSLLRSVHLQSTLFLFYANTFRLPKELVKFKIIFTI